MAEVAYKEAVCGDCGRRFNTFAEGAGDVCGRCAANPKVNCTHCDELVMGFQVGEDGRCVFCTVFHRGEGQPAASPAASEPASFSPEDF